MKADVMVYIDSQLNCVKNCKSIRMVNSINYAMAKNAYQKPSPQSQEEALKLAKATQRPAQTKEQTKLIAQGIQKGIHLYKKQQKEKSRELSKRLKKANSPNNESMTSDTIENEVVVIYRQHWLPWLLLGITWLGIVSYLFSLTNN